MSLSLGLLLAHPEPLMCDAFRTRFADLPGVEIHARHFEELPPHDCFVTAGNSFGKMTAGIDTAVVQSPGRNARIMTAINWRSGRDDVPEMIWHCRLDNCARWGKNCKSKNRTGVRP